MTDADRLVAAEAARDALQQQIVSIATMLGWENVPPPQTLEAEIRALKALAAERAALRQLIVRVVTGDGQQLENLGMTEDEWNESAGIRDEDETIELSIPRADWFALIRAAGGIVVADTAGEPLDIRPAVFDPAHYPEDALKQALIERDELKAASARLRRENDDFRELVADQAVTAQQGLQASARLRAACQQLTESEIVRWIHEWVQAEWELREFSVLNVSEGQVFKEHAKALAEYLKPRLAAVLAGQETP